jgi:aminoglycoside phosphotransferase (APT) family kinase protein
MTNSGPIVIDWEGASLGDPAYDVGWAYHVILLEGQAMIDHRFVKLKKQQAFRIDLRERFLECYENSNGKVPNLRFYKNLAAIRLLTVLDLYLRPSLYSSLRNIFEMGVRQTFSRIFYTTIEIKSFHDYCVQFLRNEGFLK